MAKMMTCNNLTCPEACCSAQPLRDHGIGHNDDHCCSHERYKDHKEMMDTLVAPFKHLSRLDHQLEHLKLEHHRVHTQVTNLKSSSTPPIPIRTSTRPHCPHGNQPGFHGTLLHGDYQSRSNIHDTFLPYGSDFSENNYPEITRWNHFPLIVSCMLAIFVVILVMVVAYYEMKRRSKYLKSKRTSGVVISHDANGAGVAVGASTYFIPNEELLTRSSSSTPYTEMMNLNGKLIISDGQATSITLHPTTQLPTYEDLFLNGNDDATA